MMDLTEDERLLALSLWVGVVLFSSILYLTGSYSKAIPWGSDAWKCWITAAAPPPERQTSIDGMCGRQWWKKKGYIDRVGFQDQVIA